MCEDTETVVECMVAVTDGSGLTGIRAQPRAPCCLHWWIDRLADEVVRESLRLQTTL